MLNESKENLIKIAISKFNFFQNNSCIWLLVPRHGAMFYLYCPIHQTKLEVTNAQVNEDMSDIETHDIHKTFCSYHYKWSDLFRYGKPQVRWCSWCHSSLEVKAVLVIFHWHSRKTVWVNLMVLFWSFNLDIGFKLESLIIWVQSWGINNKSYSIALVEGNECPSLSTCFPSHCHITQQRMEPWLTHCN